MGVSPGSLELNHNQRQNLHTAGKHVFFMSISSVAANEHLDVSSRHPQERLCVENLTLGKSCFFRIYTHSKDHLRRIKRRIKYSATDITNDY